MYMGRKANPVANKLLYEAEVRKQQEAHKRRIAAMKPSLDTKPPPEHRHLYRNAKKEQVMEGELTQSGQHGRGETIATMRPGRAVLREVFYSIDTTAYSLDTTAYRVAFLRPRRGYPALPYYLNSSLGTH
jgi:hypothetical protein